MEFLKEIFGDELYKQVKTALDAYNGAEEHKDKQIKLGNLASGEYVSRLKYDDLQALFDGKGKELDSANTLIEELKKGTKGNDELQGKVTAYETQVSQLQEQLRQTKLESAVKVALLGAKATDIDYMMFKLKEIGDLEVDEKGNVKGIDEKISDLKKQFPLQFKAEENGSHEGIVIDENRLPENQDHNKAPQTLAEALQMQFESNK